MSRTLPALLVALAACTDPRTALVHEAYVWQRAWTTDVQQAVRQAPAELHALRILAQEWPEEGTTPVEIAWPAGAIPGDRRFVLVARIDGRRSLEGVSLEGLVTRATALGAAGVEVDYDCPTDRLPGYVTWITTQRPRLGSLRVAITALPTWAGSPALKPLAAAVDAITLQVHAIRAPHLFEATEALADVKAFSRAIARPFFVALPTYRVRLNDGRLLDSEPAAVAELLRQLERSGPRELVGIAWFRLGNEGDRNAWSAATWRAVVRGTSLETRIELRAVPSADGVGALDLVVTNTGLVDADAPARLEVRGDLTFLDGLRGYAAADHTLAALAPPRLRPGESTLVGAARGVGVSLAAP